MPFKKHFRGLITYKKVRDFAYLFFVVLSRAKKTLGIGVSQHRSSSSIVALDAILKKAKSFNDFFENKPLLDSYYTELRTYFGGRFPRNAFDGICAQIKQIHKARPDFGLRIWNTKISNKSFTISAFGDSAGRSLNSNLWRIYWREYCAKIEMQSYSKASSSELEVKKKISEVISKYSLALKNFQTSQVHLHSSTVKISRKEREFLNRDFFKNATADTEFRKAVASIVALFFALPENRQLIYLSDADLLLYFFKDLRQDPRKVLTVIPGCENPDGLLSAIRAFLPDVKAMAANLDLFPHKVIRNKRGVLQLVGRSPTSEFSTRQIHPMHAIWLGIPGNDCLAGNSELLTPARWLVSASEGSLAHVIEKDGAYQGFVRCTPAYDQKGAIYGSLEIWSPLMIKNILPNCGDGLKNPREQSFFAVWLPLYHKELPKAWGGIIISESLLIDNLGVKSIIVDSEFYRNSTLLGSSHNFTLVDGTANSIAREFTTDEVRNRFGDGVIFDASIQDAGLIRLLNTF